MQKNIANKQMICNVLMEAAQKDHDIVVLCSDSRGSASATPFFEKFPAQSVEVGIAEQDLVGISAGMARVGKRPFPMSPACFITARSYEQCKVDVAYSHTNVKLIGISGGVSYGALGMSHHSAQDIACMTSIPGMRVYLPSDCYQTRALMRHLIADNEPAYIRVGRNAVDPVYSDDDCPFEMDKATIVTEGTDVAIIACGEMVLYAKQAAEILKAQGVSASVLDMYCLKPLDEDSIVKVASKARAVVSVEEHSPFGGLGSEVARVLCAKCPKKLAVLSLPDAPVITGTSKEVFAYYGLTGEGIAKKSLELLNG